MQLPHNAVLRILYRLITVKALQVAIGSIPTVAAAGDPIQLTWTTDPEYTLGSSSNVQSTFGPDGPWQAVVVNVGNFSETIDLPNSPLAVPLYPCGAGITQLMTATTGGSYNITGNSASRSVVKLGGSAGNPDDWFASVLLNSTSFGTDVLDYMGFPTTLGGINIPTNATIFAATQQWDIGLPNGKTYPNEVGVLGLGRYSDLGSGISAESSNPSLLSQIQNTSGIASKSFGLHIGSVSMNSTPSLTLGGYDQARALGPVGGFWYMQGTPFAILEDINLGVVTGGSPFGSANTKHLFTGIGDSPVGDSIRQNFGAPQGSVIIIPNPAFPYISLPPGNCEAVAKLLPVTWQPDIGFYTWNTKDPQYSNIVNSPAYMEFILADKQALNISIKVPFKLLNLTLDTPIVDTPTPYFPCQPYNSSYGFWSLGRAFLQSAFLGVSYDQNITWLAQAPGPLADQQVLKTINPSDTNITTNSIDSFEKSWSGHWTVLASDGPSASNSTSGPPTSSTSSAYVGTIAGTIVGGLAGIAIFAALTWWLCVRRRRRAVDKKAEDPLPHEVDGSAGTRYHEKPAVQTLSEVGPPLPHEIEGREQAVEAGGGGVYELPSEHHQ